MKKKTNPALIAIYACVAIFGLYVLTHLGYAVDVTTEASKKVAEGQAIDIIGVMSTFQNNLTKTEFLVPIKDKLLNKSTYTFKITIFGVMAGLLWAAYYFSSRKKYRKGEEHGSARFATEKEAKKLSDKNPANNIILTNEVQMSLDTWYTRKNLNTLILGGSGSGKTRFYVKPNLLQMNTSYIITDPKGEILRSTGKVLEENGYEIKVFNLINMKNSFNYNSFAYLYDTNGKYNDASVTKLVNTLMKNTRSEGSTGGEQFWEDATKALLLAIMYYLVYEGKENEKNWATVMEILRLADVKEDQENFKSPFDVIFEDLEKVDRRHMAVKYYRDYKKAAGKTAKSILISCAVRLSAFNIDDVINLTYKDNINIPSLGEKKTALFVVIPDSDDTFNFLVAMLYTQIFDVLYGIADFRYNGKLPVHVRFMLDEFANIGTIPKFEKLVPTMRSREISVSVVIQNLAQLKTMYKDSWESIIGNCDSLLFLGGREQSSLDYMSKALGKETIDTLNRNTQKSYRSSSTTMNEGIVGRDLMTANEIGEMPDSDCIVLIRGLHPCYSQKFVLKNHKNYPFTEDENKKNAYEIAHIRTEVMPEQQEEEKEDGEEEEYSEYDIKKILAEGAEDDEFMTSTIEIPFDEENDENYIVIEEEDDYMNGKKEKKEKKEYIIKDYVHNPKDKVSALNFDDLVIGANDVYLPEYELDDDDDDDDDINDEE